jgi:hypothetical protein
VNKENVVYMQNTVLFGHTEQNHVICRRMNGTGEHHIKRNKPFSAQ